MDWVYSSLKIKPYKIKIPAPFDEKRGLHLFFESTDGTLYMADVSPLQGYSKETLDDCLKKLDDIKKTGKCDFSSLFPSLHFAFSHPVKVTENLKKVRYQALIRQKEDLEKIKDFTTLKLKTSSLGSSEVIKICQSYHQNYVIRLDAERKDLDPKLVEFLLESPHVYQFIEEPNFKNKQEEDLKIALDETLYIERRVPENLNLVAFVYKPTLCGGLENIKAFMERQVPIIISSSYESTLGLKQLMKLQLMLSPESCAGLDTFPLKENTSPFCQKQAPWIFSI